jgi:hypothetical protein
MFIFLKHSNTVVLMLRSAVFLHHLPFLRAAAALTRYGGYLKTWAHQSEHSGLDLLRVAQILVLIVQARRSPACKDPGGEEPPVLCPVV